MAPRSFSAPAIGVLRMAAGAHFFTDVAFAGVFMFLVVWTLHGLIFRWRPTRLTDEAIEDPLVRAGEALRGAVRRVMRTPRPEILNAGLRGRPGRACCLRRPHARL